ncbi:MAG: DUF3108 domain-containing protein [Endomicrobiaceae bacterium]|nr:DUF3108 domain-containing protein [Endomicrobiaceae bacterium]
MIIRKINLMLMLLFFAIPIYCSDIVKENTFANDVIVSTQNFKWRTLKSNLPAEENLVFNIYWKIIKVGQATLEIKGFEEINGRNTYHLYSQAKSSVFFDNFFKVRDVNESWMDKESLCSLRYHFSVSEGGWKKQEQADFDHIKREFTLDDNGTIKKGAIPFFVQDIISAFYYFRTLDLEVGDEYVFDVHSGEHTWPLKTKVTGKEKIEVKAGTFECFILEPAVREDAGIFRAKGELKVWMTNDKNKMPVVMKTKTPFGSVVAELASYNFKMQDEINNIQKTDESVEEKVKDKIQEKTEISNDIKN